MTQTSCMRLPNLLEIKAKKEKEKKKTISDSPLKTFMWSVNALIAKL